MYDMRLPLHFCVISALVVAAFAQASVPNSQLYEAKTLLASGHLDQALQKLDALAAVGQESSGVEYLRGMVFYQQGRMMDAVSAFAKAVTRDSRNLAAMQMEGVSLFRAGKPAEAVPLLEQAHRSVRDANVDPNYVLGLCYIDTQRYDEARKAFAGQYGFAPDSAPAYLLAARMLLRHNYLPAADESARKALALNPNLPEVHFVLGEIALARQQLPEAIALFQQERDLNPLKGAIYERLGDAYIRGGDFVQAQEALDRAVLLEPNVSVPFILLGKVLLKQQNPMMARLYLEHALRMDPNSYMAHYLLGQAYRSAGRLDQAKREFDASEQIHAASVPKLESPQ